MLFGEELAAAKMLSILFLRFIWNTIVVLGSGKYYLSILFLRFPPIVAQYFHRDANANLSILFLRFGEGHLRPLEPPQEVCLSVLFLRFTMNMYASVNINTVRAFQSSS